MNLQMVLSELGWTQVKLAKFMGVHPNTVTKWVKDGVPLQIQRYLELRLQMKCWLTRD